MEESELCQRSSMIGAKLLQINDGPDVSILYVIVICIVLGIGVVYNKDVKLYNGVKGEFMDPISIPACPVQPWGFWSTNTMLMACGTATCHMLKWGTE